MMTYLTKIPLVVIVGSNLIAVPVYAQTTPDAADTREEHAAQLLVAGEAKAALTQLEAERRAASTDPAVLINLGIAYARLGEEARARRAFEQALASPNPVELDTADGRTMDSRRLARKALKMLERGEFRSGGDRL
jgi:cytochrome c-type biogenesis protein CcmH/NrfG